MSDKKIGEMTYSEFCLLLSEDIDDRFWVVLDYEDFKVFEDMEYGGYYYLEGGENDASDFFEVEKIACLEYSAEHDLMLPSHKVGSILSTLFDADVCGEQVLDDSIEYLWFKRKEN